MTYNLSPVTDIKKRAEYVLKLMLDGELRVLLSTKASPNSKGFVLCLQERGTQNPEFCALPQPLNEEGDFSAGRYLPLFTE